MTDETACRWRRPNEVSWTRTSVSAFRSSLKNGDVAWILKDGQVSKLAVNQLPPSYLSNLKIIVTTNFDKPPKRSDFCKLRLTLPLTKISADAHIWLEEMIQQYSHPSNREHQSVYLQSCTIIYVFSERLSLHLGFNYPLLKGNHWERSYGKIYPIGMNTI